MPVQNHYDGADGGALSRECADPAAGWAALDAVVALDIATMQRWAEVTTSEHGAIDPARAAHAGIRYWGTRDAVGGDGAAPAGTVPEWRVRLGHHESTVTRSRKGRTTFRRGRTHRAVIIGPDPVRQYLGADGADLIRLDAVSLTKLADAIYGARGIHWVLTGDDAPDVLPPLLGTDVTAFASVTPDLTVRTVRERRRIARELRAGTFVAGVRPDAAGIAIHRADIDAWANVVHTYDPRTVAATETAGWAERRRITVSRRAGERRMVTTVHAPPDGAEGPTAIVHRVWAPSSDGEHAAYGFGPWRRRPDPERVTRAARPTTREDRERETCERAERAAEAERSPIVATIRDALATAPAGTAVTVTVPRGTLTMTSGTTGRIRCVLVGADGARGSWQGRAVAGIAARVS